ncbi:MAG: M42 family metallopeptidase [Candidatus Altiarchaeota archaeon]|nr:M42 family metallopeptidase [Candidatus Altiarchaeota archaeon]
MDLLQELCTVDGISGFEKKVAEVMRRELNKTCESVEVDGFGNVIGRKGRGKTKIMIAAHMDEVGLMVKNINEKGFISFVKIGGIDDRILLGMTVAVKAKKGDVTGIIGSKPPHLQKKEEAEKIIKHEDLFIDIGAKNREEAAAKVEVGDPVAFQPVYEKLNDDFVCAKAIDDRIGCYALLKIMEQIPKNIDATVYAVGTCQEEVGLKGARVAAYKINPDYGFVLDTTIAGDTPQVKETESSLKTGLGPAITIAEACGRGLISHPKVREHLTDTAKKHNIPYQLDVVEGGMTDGAMIYLTREGVPTGVVSIACRYIHGPGGIFSMKDLDNAIKLLSKAIADFRI